MPNESQVPASVMWKRRLHWTEIHWPKSEVDLLSCIQSSHNVSGLYSKRCIL